MDAFIDKKYKCKSSEKFDDYLKFLGVGLLTRKAAAGAASEACLTKNADGSYTYTIVSTLKTIKTTFKIGEQFEVERIDGVKVKSTFEVDGNTLVETQIDEKGNKSVILREFTPEVLTSKTTIDGWDGTSIRVYELVK